METGALWVWEIYDPQVPEQNAKSDYQPIVCVDHGGMILYCADFAPGGRLPTEYEWECAAKGPSGEQEYPTQDGRKPSPSEARYLADCTVPVGSYPDHGVIWTQPDGRKMAIRDMAGNVWEGTSTWYAGTHEDLYDGQKDPTGPIHGLSRVVRGGSCNSDGDGVRSAARGDIDPRDRDDAGFRVLVPSHGSQS